jgi:hypothetical protein
LIDPTRDKLTRLEKFITYDGEIWRQAVARRKDATDAVRGARTLTTQLKILRVDREAMSAKRELDLPNGETRYGPISWPKKKNFGR